MQAPFCSLDSALSLSKFYHIEVAPPVYQFTTNINTYKFFSSHPVLLQAPKPFEPVRFGDLFLEQVERIY